MCYLNHDMFQRCFSKSLFLILWKYKLDLKFGKIGQNLVRFLGVLYVKNSGHLRMELGNYRLSFLIRDMIDIH